MVQLERHAAPDHVQARLVVHLCCLPHALDPCRRRALRQVNLRVESLCLVLEREQDRVLLVDLLKVVSSGDLRARLCCFELGRRLGLRGVEYPLAELRLRLTDSLAHVVEILLNLLEVLLHVPEGGVRVGQIRRRAKTLPSAVRRVSVRGLGHRVARARIQILSQLVVD